MTEIFNPLIFLEIAKRLMNDKNYNDVGRWRTSIGRAYYAAFLITFEKLKDAGFRIKDTNRMHQEVIEKISDEGFTRTSNKLEKLRKFRVQADYYLIEPIRMHQCRSSINLSEIIIKELETYL